MGEVKARRAVLFADVCDSTAIYESVGDAQALSLINRLLGLLERKVKACGGAVTKTLGDGMVCQFREPDAAFREALSPGLRGRCRALYPIRIKGRVGEVSV